MLRVAKISKGTGCYEYVNNLHPLTNQHRPPMKSSKSNSSRDRNAASATLGKGLAIPAFPLYVPVFAFDFLMVLNHGMER